MKIKSDTDYRGNFSVLARRHAAAAAFSTAAVLAALTPGSGRAVTATFNTATSVNLNQTSNYSTGTLPDNTTDVSLTVAKNVSPALTLSTGSLVMQSLNLVITAAASTNAVTLQNTTGTGLNTITLGSPALNNGVGGATTDLIYVKGGGGANPSVSLSILGTNASGGSLGLVLTSGGNFDTAVNTTLTIGAGISSSAAVALSKTGSGTLNLNAANNFTGTFAASAGTTVLGSNGALGGISALTVAASATLSASGTGTTDLINDAAAVTLNGNASGGAVLNLAGATETVGSLANSAANGAKTSLVIGDAGSTAGSFTVGDSNSTTFAGIISGTHTGAGAIFTKQGTGTLTLTGANTFTGGIAINGGILNLGVAEAAGTSGPLGVSGPISFGGGTLQYSASNSIDYSARFSAADNQVYSIDTNSQNVTFASPLAGNGSSLVKIGTGNLILSSGASTFTGGAVLNAGNLRVTGVENPGVSGPLGVGGPISFNGGALQFSSTNVTDYSPRFSTAANQAYNINTNTQSVEFFSPLTSSGGSLTKAGNGTLTLSSGASTFNGGVAISMGTLKMNAAEVPGVSGPLGSGGPILFNGGTLQFSSANTFDYSPRFSTADNQSFLINTNAQSVTFASPLVGNGSSLTKSSTGNLILSSSASTFNGGVMITAGTVRANAAEVPGVSGPLGSGGTILFNGGSLQFSAANTFDYSPRFSTADNQAFSISTNAQSVTLASPLVSNGGTLTKSGGGTLTLSGANTFNGGVTLSAGTLTVGSAENAGVSGPLGSAGTINLNGGTLQFSANNGFDYSPRFSTAAGQAFNIDTNGTPVTLASPLVSAGGTLTKSGASTLTLSGANTFNGGVTLTTGTLQLRSAENPGVSGPLGASGAILFNGGTLQFTTTNMFDYSPRFSTAANQNFNFNTGSQTVTLASPLVSTGGTLSKTGSGILILGGASTFSGNATLTTGTVSVTGTETPGVSGPLGTGNTILFKGGTLQFSVSNTYDYSSRFATVDSQLYSIDTAGQNVAFATPLTSNNGSLTKSGAGVLNLTAGNTYNGGTTVTAGTLQVSNPVGTSATGSGALAINAGTTLRGAGYIDAGTNLITIRGTLSPGATGTGSFGTLNFIPSTGVGAMTLTTTATLAFDLTSAASKDLIALNGSTLAISGSTLALTLPNLSSSGINYSATYALFTGVTSMTGTGFGTVTGYDATDYQAVFALNGSEYDLSFTPIPEPSTTAVTLLIAGAAAWRKRRWLPARLVA